MSGIPTIDFETRSEKDIKVGAYRYAEDSSTRVLSLAYNMLGEAEPESFMQFLVAQGVVELDLDDVLPEVSQIETLSDLIHWAEQYNETHKTQIWLPGMPDPDDLLWHIEEGGLVEAHNSFFEHCIWNLKCTELFLWPEMPIHQWRCSMAKARSNAIPGALDALGAALKLDIKKDKRGKYLIQQLCKPKRKTKKNPDTTWNNDIGLLTEMLSYNGTDVDTEILGSSKLPEMPEEEVAIWLLDQKINQRGIFVDIDAVNQTLQVLEQTTDKYQKRLEVLSGGEFSTSGQRVKIMDWCEAQGFPLPGFTKDDVEKALSKSHIPDNVREVLEIRQILGKTSTAKYTAMVDKIAEDGRIHEVLVYHKAHTGRWGGAGIQVQNLPRPTIDEDPEFLVDVLRTGDLPEVETWFDNPFEVAASSIRSMICAEPGKELISADYSAIEARVLLWLAEDEKGLDVFRKGECIYCDMAGDIYNIPSKQVYNGYKSGDFEAGKQRHLGKQTILGLGYQMGAPKFIEASGISDMTEEFSKTVVKAYRTKYRSIVELWYGLEQAAMDAVMAPGQIFTYGKIKFKVSGMFLLCRLPSGRCLHYPYPKIKLKKTNWGEDKPTLRYMAYRKGMWLEEFTYGGKIVENVTQAVARDLMRDALLRLEEAKYWVIMSVHDEAVSEVEKGWGTIDEYCEIMCDSEPWAEGLPVKAEGWRGHRYRK